MLEDNPKDSPGQMKALERLGRTILIIAAGALLYWIGAHLVARTLPLMGGHRRAIPTALEIHPAAPELAPVPLRIFGIMILCLFIAALVFIAIKEICRQIAILGWTSFKSCKNELVWWNPFTWLVALVCVLVVIFSWLIKLICTFTIVIAAIVFLWCFIAALITAL